MAGCTNSNLNRAIKARDDEWYTQYKDIDAELPHYASHLRGKSIYCNCDTSESKFVQWFEDNAIRLGIKDLRVSGIDFESLDSLRALRASDVVVTNPPFSIWRRHLAQAYYEGKGIIVIGNINTVFLNGVFDMIKDDKLRIGYAAHGMRFHRPDGSLKHVPACWFTTYPVSKPEFVPTMKVGDMDYRRYDSHPDIIEVSRTAHIPIDYHGPMGVPVSYLDKHDGKMYRLAGRARTILDGKELYGRIIIQRKDAPVPWREPNKMMRLI